ncbi:MAG: DUF72 domain-containing protein [Actinomycetota bacterium]|nr:DUF72 domain-containing protein [Actinomycetota bacterium]
MTGPQVASELHVGCAMWAHKGWLGKWFPGDTSAGSELSAYATWCTGVEGNTSFYAVPSEQASARWVEQVPPDFRFCFKLPRTITHDRRLQNAEGELADFLLRLEPMAPLLGPIQIQLPASLGPDSLPQLRSFLGRLPTSFDWAVEVRHLDFFVGGSAERPFDDLLASPGVNRVVLDSRTLFAVAPITTPEHDAWKAKPRVPVRPVATASQPLVRLIGRTDTDGSLDDWAPWYPKIAEWISRGLRPHVFAHTPDNLEAPRLARSVWERINDAMAPGALALAPLPTPRRPAEQLQVEV